MKVVLLQDVKNLGKKYEIKEVKEGHAINLLIPRGLVEVATDGVEEKYEKLRLQEEAKKDAKKDMIKERFLVIGGAEVVIMKKASEEGHLFASIHAGEISDSIKANLGVEINPEWIKISSPIKSVGEHNIKIETEGEKTEIKLIVKTI